MQPTREQHDQLLDRIRRDLESWSGTYQAATAAEQPEIIEQFLQRTLERFPDELDESGEPSAWLVQLYAIHQQAVSGKSSVDTAIRATEKLLYMEGDEGVLPEALAALDSE